MTIVSTTLYVRADNVICCLQMCWNVLVMHVCITTSHCITVTRVQGEGGRWAWMGWMPKGTPNEPPACMTCVGKTPGGRVRSSHSTEGAVLPARTVGVRGSGTSATLFTGSPRAWPNTLFRFSPSPLSSASEADTMQWNFDGVGVIQWFWFPNLAGRKVCSSISMVNPEGLVRKSPTAAWRTHGSPRRPRGRNNLLRKAIKTSAAGRASITRRPSTGLTPSCCFLLIIWRHL